MSPLQWAFLPIEKYANFSGRAPRAEYWWFHLFQMLLGLVTTVIDSLLELDGPGSPLSTNLILSLALFLPALAVTVRRFHDINRSGWSVLTTFVPIFAVLFLQLLTPVGWALLVFGGWIAGILLALVTIWVLVKFIGFMATEGNPGDNLYGPDPYGRRYGY
jgi:uncharacterized membrane protein YhaH (DUF805 family)